MRIYFVFLNCVNYCMVYVSVREDNPLALASYYLPYRRVHHIMTFLFHHYEFALFVLWDILRKH